MKGREKALDGRETIEPPSTTIDKRRRKNVAAKRQYWGWLSEKTKGRGGD